MIMELEKYKDIPLLEEIAAKQDNKLNLSVILITLNCKVDDIQDIMDYFEKKGIEIVNEDIEPGDETDEIDGMVVPFDPSKIDIKMDKITIDSIVKRIKNNELEFDSSFQRKVGLWNIKQKSRLIESIFLKIPLPAFYFDASNDDKWQIIDGLQRIGTIREYVVEKSFKLSGLEFLKDFKDLAFDELPRSMQRRIEETNLNAYLVNPSTPKNVKFNIFKRINTGGLVLEPQEIRNALYQGNAAQFILKLSQEKSFIEATDNSIKSDRMLDREFCLRYIAFTQLDSEKNYMGNMDEFLNQGMEYLNNKSVDEYNKLLHDFVKTMDVCNRIFGKLAFRRINDKKRRGPVNKSLFETWSLIISKLSDDEISMLIKKRKYVINEFVLLCKKASFQNAIRAADKGSVKTRITEIRKLVNTIIEKRTL